MKPRLYANLFLWRSTAIRVKNMQGEIGMSLTRRQFVRTVPTLGVFSASSARLGAQEPSAGPAWPAPPPAPAWRDDTFPSHHPHLAREIVGVAHRDLARVTELVTAHPSLAKASWDWGFGDWETALGSASHVGNRPIAEFLIQQGAPPTIFSAAMLGQLDVVKAYAAAIPDIHLLRGPHGIPLAAHARAGGAQAERVLEFLTALGAATPPVPVVPLSDGERSALEGRYIFGSGPRDAFSVKRDGSLWGIQRAGGELRGLTHIGNLQFHPVGAPAVRISFDGAPTATTLTVIDADVVVTARKS
jgi:hypothetical protein